ncbi:MAG: metal-dependent transcriptional regulator [Lachnospiraceae bacterium]
MQESGENYLETIYLLQQAGNVVHSVDVAKALGFSKPSVSRAMGLLKDAHYIEVARNGEISLTKTGLKKAKDLSLKREALTRFLMMTADVSRETAEKDACKMEHFIQEETFQGVLKFMKQVDEYEA